MSQLQYILFNQKKQMDMIGILKQICKVSLKKDFKQIFMENIGDGIFQEAQFEEVQNSKTDNAQQNEDHDDFYIEQEEQIPKSTIKTMQFNNSMIKPNNFVQSQSNFQKINDNWKVTSIGFNATGADTIILVMGQICRAIGCCLILKDQPYFSHCYQICLLKFDKEKKVLISGSEGLCPEIVIWQVIKNEKGMELKMKTKMHQPRKSLGVGCMMIVQNYLLSVDKIDIHRSCSGYLFDTETGKRIGGTIKLQQKVFGMEVCKSESQNFQVYFATNQGISLLKLPSKLLNTSSPSSSHLVKPGNSYTSLIPTASVKMLIANKSGQIQLFENQTLKRSSTYSIHKGWISCVKQISKQLFASIGAQDNTVNILKVNNKVEVLRQISLTLYARSLTYDQNLQAILIGCRDGTHQTYKIQYVQGKGQQQIKLQQIQKMSHKLSYMIPLKIQGKFYKQSSGISYNRHSEQFIFYSRNSKNILFVNIETGKQSVYSLRQDPLCLDSSQTQVVYAIKQKTKRLSKQSPSILKMKEQNSKSQIKEQSSIIYWQNFINKQLLHKVLVNNETVSCMKISTDGYKLCIGTKNGGIKVIQKHPQSKQYQKEENCTEEDKHKGQVLQIYWSKKGEFIKSISEGQLFHWEVSKEGKIVKIKAKKTADVQWNNQQRFPLYNWQIKQIWDQISFISDISSVGLLGQKNKVVLVGMENGKLRVYNYPSKKNKFKEFNFFNNKVNVFAINNIFGVHQNGAIMMFTIKET